MRKCSERQKSCGLEFFFSIFDRTDILSETHVPKSALTFALWLAKGETYYFHSY